MWNKNIKNKPKKCQEKNVLDGFSRILDIQKISGGGPQTPLEKWDTWSEPSLFYKTFLLTTTTSQPGGANS